jgi:phosphoglycerate dehydrogenase-like enzyme
MHAPERNTAMVLAAEAPDYARALRERFPSVAFHPVTSYDEIGPVMADVRPDIALAFKIAGPFPRRPLVENESLKWLHAGGAGVDHLVPWDAGRLRVTNSAGTHGDIMAQYVLCAILMRNQHMPTYSRQQRVRRWASRTSRTVAGQTLTIVGCGQVGSAIGALARQVGMRVIAVRSRPTASLAPSPAADQFVGPERLLWAVGEADHVAITLPLTSRTRGSIDASVIGALKPGAHFINVSRGGIVDETALLAALRSGTLAATLDVFATEPLPENSPFWNMENVVISPHSSSDIDGWQDRVIAVFAENLDNWLAGRPLRNLIDPAREY